MPEREALFTRLPWPGWGCPHAYPPGEYCPACGDVPGPYDGGMLAEEHDDDCECFACEEV